MVLSNKKLKQKLRSTVAQSVAEKKQESAVVQHEVKKEILGSSAPKLRLSKREKRRKISSLQQGINGNKTQKEAKTVVTVGPEGVNLNDKKKEKKKKRKREEIEGKGNENGVSEEGSATKKKPDKKKAKKKNKKKKNDKVVDAKEEAKAEQPLEVPESQENVDAGTKIYAGGIPYYSTEEDIRSFFENCGTIIEVDCMRFPETGKFRGIAMLTFKTEAAAKRALALDGADMGGLFLKIQPYKAPRESLDFAPEIIDGYNRVYVGNLSWDIREEELRKLFSDCKITSIRFGEDKTTGEFRGYAHVDFADNLSLTIALQLDQKIVSERPVRIRCAVPKINTENYIPVSKEKKKTENVNLSSSGGGKKRRRTCYDCGVPGHISSTCPKKQPVDPANSS